MAANLILRIWYSESRTHHELTRAEKQRSRETTTALDITRQRRRFLDIPKSARSELSVSSVVLDRVSQAILADSGDTSAQNSDQLLGTQKMTLTKEFKHAFICDIVKTGITSVRCSLPIA